MATGGDMAADVWQAPHPLTIDKSALYLVKTNGQLWRDTDTFVWPGALLIGKLKSEIERGRPLLVARVHEPDVNLE